MDCVPAIYGVPRSIGLRTWPLQGHVARTHDTLPQIVVTVMYMFSTIAIQQLSYVLYLIILVDDAFEEHEVKLADLAQTMQLMKEADRIDLSPWC